MSANPVNAASASTPRLPDALTSLVSRATRRIFLADLARTVCVALTVAFGALLAAVIVTRLTPWSLPWLNVSLAAIGVAITTALVWSLVRLPRGAARAEEIDRRVGLRESLSTAYVMSSSTDPWSRAVVDSAVERSRRVVLRDSIPITIDSNRAWWATILGGAFVATLVLMPRADLTGMLAMEKEEMAQRQEAQAVRMEVQEQETKLNQMLADAGISDVDDAEETNEEATLGQPETAEDIRREAVRKLTRVSEKLDEVRKGEQAQSLEAMRQAMRKLTAPKPGPLSEFQNALARGQFAQAKAQIEKLAEQMQSGEMSEEQRQQMGEQLQALSEQLENLSEQREQVEQAMRQAGMSAEQAQQAARDPNALEKMLQDMPGIPAPQQMALRQMAQAQQNASESMQSMAAAAQQMSQACEQGGQQGGPQPQAGQAADQMASQLSSAEMAAQSQAAAEAAMAEAQSQLSSLGESMCEGGACAGGDGQGQSGMGKTGQWAEGNNQTEGRGSGGGGRGTGVGPDALATDFVLKREQAKVDTQGGPIIGETVVQGAQVRGESRAQFSSVVTSANAEAAEAIETMRVPREYHDAVRAYFGRLERASRGETDGGSSDGSADAPADNNGE